MKANPLNGGLKGTTYDGPGDPDLPPFVWGRSWTDEKRQAWIDSHNDRYRIVATCPLCPPEKAELIAEEVDQHRMNHLGAGAKQIAGAWRASDASARAEFLAFLDAHPDFAPA